MLIEIVKIMLDYGQERINIDALVDVFFNRVREELNMAQEILTKGTLMIQAGDNPSLIKDEMEKLVPLINPVPSEIIKHFESLAGREAQQAFLHLSFLYDQYARISGTAADPETINKQYLKKL